MKGDRDELVRVFENLVENALKYGAPGKRIDIFAAAWAEASRRRRSWVCAITVQASRLSIFHGSPSGFTGSTLPKAEHKEAPGLDWRWLNTSSRDTADDWASKARPGAAQPSQYRHCRNRAKLINCLNFNSLYCHMTVSSPHIEQ